MHHSCYAHDLDLCNITHSFPHSFDNDDLHRWLLAMVFYLYVTLGPSCMYWLCKVPGFMVTN